MERFLIVGGGLSGLSAAIRLAKEGCPVSLISVQSSQRAQSVLAEGGINGVLNTMGDEDEVRFHTEDTLRGGVYLANPEAVEGMTARAPEIIKWLAGLGVPFNRNPDGSIAQRYFGGQKKRRTAFSQSSTGKILMTALIDEVRKYEAQGLITRYYHHFLVRLLMEGEECIGIRVRDDFTGEHMDFKGRVLLAIGGLAGMLPGKSTGSYANTGSATAVMFTQGLAMANLEMLQYHPTTLSITNKRLLISEAARGEGGRLFIEREGQPWYFMEEKYPELKNLMPRDVVSREIYGVLKREDTGDKVYLDMRGLDEVTWREKLSDLREEIIHYTNLDPAVDPVPVEPGIHYFMGGIYVDERHRTSIPGVYAAGECACQYHGANRLGGNSLLGAIYGGLRAAEDMIETMDSEAEVPDEGPIPYTGEDEFFGFSSPDFDKRLGDILYGSLGIIRDEEGLSSGLEALEDMAGSIETSIDNARYMLGSAMLLSALGRRESRGAHTRSDYPDTLDSYRKTGVCTCRDGVVKIDYFDV